MKTLIKDGGWRPDLSADQNHFCADTTRPLGEHLRQVLKKSNQWRPHFRRFCSFSVRIVVSKSFRTDSDSSSEFFFVLDEESHDFLGSSSGITLLSALDTTSVQFLLAVLRQNQVGAVSSR